MKRVLAINLDAYEPTLGHELMEAGEMPAFRDLADRSARFELNHGSALRTGLAGEHIATGLSPDDAKRWAAVHFNPQTYEVTQEGTSSAPFTKELPIKTIVFDTPYFDLKSSPKVEGIVNWGAHDPGVATMSRPNGLLDEVIEKFGAYPAKQWLYGLSWNSKANTRQAGELLTQAVDTRSKITEWLLTERITDWDLAIISVSEAHSVIEGLWHGIDTNHPLNSAPTSKIAGEGVRNVYKGIDRLVGRLSSNIEDVTIILFSMHGMGSNRGDIASFLLLAEMLYRDAHNDKLFSREGESSVDLNQQVYLPTDEGWTEWVRDGFIKQRSKPKSIIRNLASSLTPQLVKNIYRGRQKTKKKLKKPNNSLNWMPAAFYRSYWPSMSAFAIPSYYDGRVRINLCGREKNGIVPLEQYQTECERIINLIKDCKDPLSGESVVDFVEPPTKSDPMKMNETEADIVFVWKGAPTGFLHPKHGKIGPVPYRRTGGHTGGNGFAYIYNSNLESQDYGVRSSFDVIPSILDILDINGITNFSGESLLTAAR